MQAAANEPSAIAISLGMRTRCYPGSQVPAVLPSWGKVPVSLLTQQGERHLVRHGLLDLTCKNLEVLGESRKQLRLLGLGREISDHLAFCDLNAQLLQMRLHVLQGSLLVEARASCLSDDRCRRGSGIGTIMGYCFCAREPGASGRLPSAGDCRRSMLKDPRLSWTFADACSSIPSSAPMRSSFSSLE